MTDQELLEKAAKAAGWKGWRSKHGYWNLTSPTGDEHTCCAYWASYDATDGTKLPEPTFVDALIEAGWNPIHDDGDALRLAVTLRLTPLFHDESESVSVMHDGCLVFPDAEQDGTDLSAATRRAIVRAAAAMAKD